MAELEAALSGSAEVLRVDCLEVTAEAVAAMVVQKVFAKHNGESFSDFNDEFYRFVQESSAG